MITALTLLAKASVILALVWLMVSIAGRRGSAAMRHECWALAAVALLLLPILTFALPAWTVVRFATPPRLFVPITNVETSPRDVASSTSSTPVGANVLSQRSAAAGALMTWPVALGAMYAIGVLLLLTRLAWQIAIVISCGRGGSEDPPLQREAMRVDAEWSALLAECARELGIRRPVRLLRTAAHTMPTAFGILDETIVIPSNADSWSADRRRAVMLHELAHVERRDCLTQLIASVACVVYWPHPAVWWMARRLRVERELACDDLVLSVGTSPRDYAGHLLDIAYALQTRFAPALSVSMANPRQLERRMLALLDASRNRATPHLRSRFAMALLGATLVGAVAAATVSASDEGGVFPEGAPAERAQATPSAGTALRAGMWEIRPVAERGQVHLRMRDERGFHGHNVDLDRLSGLAPSLLTGAGGVTGFSIRHDAGTFTFEGVFRNGVGSGTFTFTSDNGFAQMMVARGYGRPTTNQLAMLARQDVGMAFLVELIAQGYRGSTLAQIVRAVDHGIDTGYLRDMGNLGYRVGTIDTLIDMRDHGVNPQYIQGMAAEGLTGLSASELIRARDHGVGPQYIQDMGQLGLRLVGLDALINFRDHGVSADYVRGMRDEGFALSADELIRARDQGVSAAYVRDMRGLGYTLRLDQLIRARDQGVSPEYVRELRRLGYQTLTLDTLIRLRDHGISPEYIDELVRLGYAPLTIEELVSLRDHGVSPDEVRRANARAGTRLPVARLLRLADGGWRQSRQELRFTSKLSSLL